MRNDERGFAIVAAALLVAVSIFFGIAAAVVVEHSHMVEGAAHAQQMQSIRSREELSLWIVSENTVEVVNKGALPSVIVAFLINTENGLVVKPAENVIPYLGAFENKTFTITGEGDLREFDVGVLTQLGNVFWRG
jgi:hypothetical protein